MKQLSIVIPYFNDVDTLIGTLNSLHATIDIDKFEVIVVNDGSQYVLPQEIIDQYDINHISQFVNLGVGQAFDLGVRNAQSENIILMGADIRFEENGWATRMLQIIDKSPKAIVCTTCKSNATERREYGADVIFKMTVDQLGPTHPQKGNKDYRAALEGKWRPKTGRGVYCIPSLMGAFYGVKKEWYDHVRGFELHYKWGVLEPYISLKTWRMGGEVLIDTDNLTKHIWRNPQRSPDFGALMYNQLMVSGVVFGNYGIKYASFIGGSSDLENPKRGSIHYEVGMEMYGGKQESISALNNHVEDNAVMSGEELEQMMVDMSFEYNNKNRYPTP
jgi:glycosyltransferase involved in cell wall biosynthesis